AIASRRANHASVSRLANAEANAPAGDPTRDIRFQGIAREQASPFRIRHLRILEAFTDSALIVGHAPEPPPIGLTSSEAAQPSSVPRTNEPNPIRTFMTR